MGAPETHQPLAPSTALPSGTRSLNGTSHVMNYIGGAWVESRGTDSFPVMNPSIGRQIAAVLLSTASDVEDAVRAAQRGFASWSALPIKERAQVFYRYKALLEKNIDALSSKNGHRFSTATRHCSRRTSMHCPHSSTRKTAKSSAKRGQRSRKRLK